MRINRPNNVQLTQAVTRRPSQSANPAYSFIIRRSTRSLVSTRLPRFRVVRRFPLLETLFALGICFKRKFDFRTRVPPTEYSTTLLNIPRTLLLHHDDKST